MALSPACFPWESKYYGPKFPDYSLQPMLSETLQDTFSQHNLTMQGAGTCNHMQKCWDTLQVTRGGSGSETLGCQSTKNSNCCLLSHLPYLGLP